MFYQNRSTKVYVFLNKWSHQWYVCRKIMVSHIVLFYSIHLIFPIFIWMSPSPGLNISPFLQGCTLNTDALNKSSIMLICPTAELRTELLRLYNMWWYCTMLTVETLQHVMILHNAYCLDFTTCDHIEQSLLLRLYNMWWYCTMLTVRFSNE